MKYPYYLNVMLHRSRDPLLEEFRKTLTYTRPHLHDTLAPEDQALRHDEAQKALWQQQWQAESRPQLKRAAGQREYERVESQQIIDSIDDVYIDSNEREALIQQLRSTDEKAYKQWLRAYDAGAYRDEYGVKKSANRSQVAVKKHSAEALTQFDYLYKIVDDREAI